MPKSGRSPGPETSFMIVECFLDTNIIVYAAAGRGPDEWKRIRAFELLEPAEFGLSGQVLQEFYVTVTTKARVKLPEREAAEWVDRLSLMPVAPIASPSSPSVRLTVFDEATSTKTTNGR